MICLIQKCSESIEVILQLLALAFFNKIEAPHIKLSLLAIKSSYEFVVKKKANLSPDSPGAPKITLSNLDLNFF